MKARILSKTRLCKAGLELGLSKFILTQPFSGRNWHPAYIEDALGPQKENKREMSTQIIADVVQALVGAGWRMESSVTALPIVRILLPEVDLPSIETARVQLFDFAPKMSCYLQI
jgi:dsRNA-specific ribonuclease